MKVILAFILMLSQLFSAREGLAFRANRLVVDEKEQTVLAEGNVLIKYKERYVKADRIKYYKNKNLVVAEGHIQMDERSGHIIMAEYAEIHDHLKDGYIQHIKVLLSDHSKLSAMDGEYERGVSAQVNNVRYSPCRFCRQDKNSKPLWQVRARNAYWDLQKRDIEYTDAVMEFWGIPVFYMPILSHPDPTVERRSGFLSPSIYGGRSGHMIETPYYVALDKSRDVTIASILGTKSQILKTQYRQRFYNGLYKFKGSVGHTNRQKLYDNGGARYHVDTELKKDINDHWRSEIAVRRTSNKSYLRRYRALDSSGRAFLTSKVNAEGFYDQTYIQVQGYSFQGLMPQDRVSTTPIVLPQFDINYRSYPLWAKSYITVDGNVLSLQRRQGEGIMRGVTKSGWHLPISSVWGDEYLISLEARADGYNYRPDKNNSGLNTSTDIRNRQLGRFIPTATVAWKYPFLSQGYRYPIVVEPCASLIVKPTRKLNKNFPNEDSRIREIDDVNHMYTNRFPGLDRVDEGSRINYGIKSSLMGLGARPTSIYMGQSYNLRTLSPEDLPLGVHKRLSDYVMRITASPTDYVDVRYRNRLEYKKFTPRRHEFLGSVGPNDLKFSATYAMIKTGTVNTDELSARQLGFAISTQYIKYWTFEMGGMRQFGLGGRFLTRYAKATYLDECFRAEFYIAKNQYFDDSVGRGITYMARVNFLTMGDFNNPRDTKPEDNL